ncbi:MAG TPA: hypothetical protein VFQ88_15180 [Nevskiaceae bacterium]|nr:hypothetical protein [Nevskiaceae bacterium]
MRKSQSNLAIQLEALTREALPVLEASSDAAARESCTAFRTILRGRTAIAFPAIDIMDATEHHADIHTMAAYELAEAWFDFAAQPSDARMTPDRMADIDRCVRCWLVLPTPTDQPAQPRR